jgi:isochorismate synthase EntC
MARFVPRPADAQRRGVLGRRPASRRRRAARPSRRSRRGPQPALPRPAADADARPGRRPACAARPSSRARSGRARRGRLPGVRGRGGPGRTAARAASALPAGVVRRLRRRRDDRSRTGRHAAGTARGADGTLADVRLEIGADVWAARVAAVREALAAGDSYQVNLTTGFRCRVGDVRQAYRALSAAQPVPFGALLDSGELQLASCSPELFVRAAAGSDGLALTARPMKGTAPRHADPEDDARAGDALRADPKSRAENVMIVDLLRHDLGRLARPGSVTVHDLLALEPYRTVWQLTSTIRAEARPDVGLAALLAALFPCGSVTGAPKRRTMQLIAALEDVPRGVYTGAIGFALPDARGGLASSVWSVAIRTLVVQGGQGRLGVGGGIVIDSDAQAEHAELLAKGRFLTHPTPAPTLFETMRHEGGALLRWPRHRERMARSAAALGLPFDAAAAFAAATAAAGRPRRRPARPRRRPGSAGAAGGRAPPRRGPSPCRRRRRRPAARRRLVRAPDPLRRPRPPPQDQRPRRLRRRQRLGPRLGRRRRAVRQRARPGGRGGDLQRVRPRRGRSLAHAAGRRRGAAGRAPGRTARTGEAVEAPLEPHDLTTGVLAIGNALRGLRRVVLDPGRRWRPSLPRRSPEPSPRRSKHRGETVTAPSPSPRGAAAPGRTRPPPDGGGPHAPVPMDRADRHHPRSPSRCRGPGSTWATSTAHVPGRPDPVARRRPRRPRRATASPSSSAAARRAARPTWASSAPSSTPASRST